MRRLLILLVVFAQLSVLAWMVLGKEWVILRGERLYLQTAPIDPRDPFRGDFVRLSYPMNNLARVDLRLQHLADTGDENTGAAKNKNESSPLLRQDQPVYAVLQQLSHNREESGTPTGTETYTVSYVSDIKPDEGLFIKGRVSQKLQAVDQNMPARFGIEQLFVEQGAGIEIEEKLGVRGGWQIPLEVELAVGKNGTAVIVGHRFAKLGMQLEPIRRNETVEATSTGSSAEGGENNNEDNNEDNQPNARPVVSGVKLLLKNVSKKSISISDPTHRCAWLLAPARALANERYSQARVCEADRPDDIPGTIELAVDETVSVDVLFASEEWFVKDDRYATGIEAGEKPVSTGDLRIIASAERFRLRFSSGMQAKDSAEGLSKYWSGVITSPAFDGQARVD